jgi:hypothetical protein
MRRIPAEFQHRAHLGRRSQLVPLDDSPAMADGGAGEARFGENRTVRPIRDLKAWPPGRSQRGDPGAGIRVGLPDRWPGWSREVRQ